MNNTLFPTPATRFSEAPSFAARQRMQSQWGEPLFIAGWHRVLMIHFEVDAALLQRDVPLPLDLFAGRAFVSLVAFTMTGMRPTVGGRLTAGLFQPIATHDFLNVRTYVRHKNECGIHFLAEWLSSRMAVALGPTFFGLPYRYGQLTYQHDWPAGVLRGKVADARNGHALEYHARKPEGEPFQPAVAGSLTEWLMERYTSFNAAGLVKRFFRVWHPPWPQCPVDITVTRRNLLTQTWPWFETAQLRGGNYCPGLDHVWMGRPHLW